ncbi:unnamed protein product [Euphydryas editha]|uniref:Beta-casein n=1 Tax=Euphydryas editha TaxID=104508 RepID=A0AAU9TEM3_EUPED|nr:unnamed protein product [Euphydryas editha]
MRLLQVSIVLSIIFVQNVFSRRCNRMGYQNAIMTALQGAMGQNNYERAVAALPRVEKSVPVVPQPPVAIPREINLPNARLVEQKYPCQMERMIPMEIVPQIPNLSVYPTAPPPAVPLPQMLYLQHTPEVVLPNSYSVPTPVFERRGRTCVGPSPAPIINPLLPAASPVSAWAPPTSNLLPPVDPSQVRSHFLRKIPIPPPTL